MKQSLVKLVDVILQRIEKRPESLPSENGIRSWLAGEGYPKRDIEAAMRVITPRLATWGRAMEHSTLAVRNLSPYEQFKMTREARDAFIRLDLYQLISPYEREMILDRLHQIDGTVGLDELDYLLSWAVSERDLESQSTLSAVFEDRRDILH